tara:strand:- start:447 stop:2519 length:2073 start_codon:yes stop_codon:yes gene_type:complete
MSKQQKGLSKAAGVLASLAFIAVAVVMALPILNLVIAFELLFSPAAKYAVVACVPLSGAAIGAWMLRKRRPHDLPDAIQWIIKIGIVASLAMAVFVVLRIQGIFDPYAHQRTTWREVVDSEEAILSLDPALKRLGFAVSNLSLPDFQSRQLFDNQVEWNDLSGNRQNVDEALGKSLLTNSWDVSGTSTVSSKDSVQLWQDLLKSVAYFEHAKFYVVRGSFATSAKETFETDIEFEGSARMSSGHWSSMHGSLNVTWKRIINQEGHETWHISHWLLKNLESMDSDRMLFEDVLDEALPRLNDLTRARTSIHEQFVIDSLESERGPYLNFARDSGDQHPGVSVVDLNQDGYDDFYVMERSGPNLFYQNNGNGTFSEVGKELGLAIENHTSSAIFADFDNDGDKDAFLGRTLLSSLYLENVEGHFIDRSGKSAGRMLPSLVSSVSAVDFDNDGLLDVYFSTSAADMLAVDPWAAARYLKPSDHEQLQSILNSDETHEYLGRPGPPNLLLRNLGNGRFGDPGLAGTDLAIFKNSLQSSWVDFDSDGDEDLYIANDFATNNLFRNDEGRFVNVAEETGTTDIGFGMGVTWGDYDNDGDQDLYVSNMFSKAGRRITAQFDYIDPRFALMARGNSLFSNAGETFKKVSGLTPPSLLLEKAGWSFGSQYIDADNDGYLDIYALSGHYTSPRENGLPDL